MLTRGITANLAHAAGHTLKSVPLRTRTAAIAETGCSVISLKLKEYCLFTQRDACYLWRERPCNKISIVQITEHHPAMIKPQLKPKVSPHLEDRSCI